MKVKFDKRRLDFKFPAGTSRGTLHHHNIWIVKIWTEPFSEVFGLGECAPLKGLSVDYVLDFEVYLKDVCKALENYELPKSVKQVYTLLDKVVSHSLPAIRFGLEQALLDLLNGAKRKIFDNSFFRGEGIPINGLIWMGNQDFMFEQTETKLKEGFNCLKMKVGAIDFDAECEILHHIRKRFTPDDLILRVDANGAFGQSDVNQKLETLSQFDLHSIEQPIKSGQPELMNRLCKESKISIALDEELIGITDYTEKRNLLETIKPQFIILKPTLLGGFKACDEWIEIADSLAIGWWITSALESNIGLNAICQYSREKDCFGHQGLGTGKLYHNNFKSPLTIEKGNVYYRGSKWEIDLFS